MKGKLLAELNKTLQLAYEIRDEMNEMIKEYPEEYAEVQRLEEELERICSGKKIKEKAEVTIHVRINDNVYKAFKNFICVHNAKTGGNVKQNELLVAIVKEYINKNGTCKKNKTAHKSDVYISVSRGTAIKFRGYAEKCSVSASDLVNTALKSYLVEVLNR